MTTPSSIYTGAPSLTHETLGDQASQIFYEDSVERFRNYLNRWVVVMDAGRWIAEMSEQV
jgi:hypothetical protein